MAETNTNITFSDTSTNNPNKFDWDFGDGITINNLTQNSVTHKYILPGIYIIRHKAYNTCGPSNECTKELIVTDPLKWKCYGSPDYQCIQATDGTYTTQTECQAACIPPSNIIIEAVSTGNGQIKFDNDLPTNSATKSYTIGSLYTLTAIPNVGYTFEKWVISSPSFPYPQSIPTIDLTNPVQKGTATVNMTYTAYFKVVLKWKCSGAPLYQCSQEIDGTYTTQDECLNTCYAPPSDLRLETLNVTDNVKVSQKFQVVATIKNYSQTAGTKNFDILSDGYLIYTINASVSGNTTQTYTTEILATGVTPLNVGFHIISIDTLYKPLVIVELKWKCSGLPLYICTQALDGTYNTQEECLSACIIPCTPDWKCEQPLNGYETDGCGNRRLNPSCNRWKCSGEPLYTCIQSSDGIYNTQSECLSACQAPPSSPDIKIEDIIIPSTIVIGETLYITAIVKNYGNATGSKTVKLYSDNTLFYAITASNVLPNETISINGNTPINGIPPLEIGVHIITVDNIVKKLTIIEKTPETSLGKIGLYAAGLIGVLSLIKK